MNSTTHAKELTQRGRRLPTNGLKPTFVERLQLTAVQLPCQPVQGARAPARSIRRRTGSRSRQTCRPACSSRSWVSCERGLASVQRGSSESGWGRWRRPRGWGCKDVKLLSSISVVCTNRSTRDLFTLRVKTMGSWAMEGHRRSRAFTELEAGRGAGGKSRVTVVGAAGRLHTVWTAAVTSRPLKEWTWEPVPRLVESLAGKKVVGAALQVQQRGRRKGSSSPLGKIVWKNGPRRDTD
jgi:hypothetical protein